MYERSELPLEIQRTAPLFSRIEPARYVRADQPIHEGPAKTNPARRTTDIAPVRTATSPTEIEERHPPESGRSIARFAAREPVAVAGHCSCGLAAHRVRAAEEPEAL